MVKTEKLVAITQPDFFPWLGSLYKFANVDEFVFLDHVANRVKDGIWTKRVKILQNKEPNWLTVPLKKDKGAEFIPINQMRIADDKSFISKHLKTIEMNYKKAEYFDEIMPLIERWYGLSSDLIVERNVDFLKQLIGLWEIPVSVSFSSEMDCQATSNELLVEIVEKVGGNEYLYGTGSVGYLKPEVFEAADIQLTPQEYKHPEYKQLNSTEFVAGLSCIDALMNCGIGGTKTLVCDG